MTARTFLRILEDGIQKQQIPAKTEAARKWYRNQATQIKRIDTMRVMGESREAARNRVVLGGMYLYYYRPKHIKTLPYYDRFPLIFPFRVVSGGFYGINMHYLGPVLRAKLMDALYNMTNNKQYDESTKLMLSYRILNSAAKFRWYKPCVKHYLNNHVQSKFYLIQPQYWDTALFLPLQKFVGAKQEQVWKDSRRKV